MRKFLGVGCVIVPLPCRPQHTMDTRSRELNDLREVTHVEKRKNQERISTLFRDLNEVGLEWLMFAAT